MKGLADKVVLVTGAARGIGRALAARFAEEGAKVAIADIDAEGAAKTASEIGRGAVGVRLDVTDGAQFAPASRRRSRSSGRSTCSSTTPAGTRSSRS